MGGRGVADSCDWGEIRYLVSAGEEQIHKHREEDRDQIILNVEEKKEFDSHACDRVFVALLVFLLDI
jgi:uncharacterized membrane protein